jgi:hypothetical protein
MASTSATTAPDGRKTNELVETITNGILAKLTSAIEELRPGAPSKNDEKAVEIFEKALKTIELKLDTILNEVLTTVVLLNGLSSRVELLETDQKLTAPTNNKRAPRGERQPEGLSVVPGAATPVDNVQPKAVPDDACEGKFNPSKIKNAMLYCRWKWATSDSFRQRYGEPSILDALAKEEKFAKMNPENRLIAEGNMVWKISNEAAKKAMKDEHTRWLEEEKRLQIQEPLNADTTDFADPLTPGDLL